MAAGEVPALIWGASYANTFEADYPIDNATTWPDPREGSDHQRVSSGEEDAWITGWNQYLEGDWRWLDASAWDGATGFEAALQWLWEGNVGRLAPDKDTPGTYFEVYLDQWPGKPDIGEDGTRRLRLRFREANDDPFTGW